MYTQAVSIIDIKRVAGADITDAEDMLAVEEPLEIRMEYGAQSARIQKNLSVTMRTPGDDAELAAGFLFTEGIIRSADEIKGVTTGVNTVLVSLREHCLPEIKRLERNFYTTSSCGVCGKTSIEAVKTVCNPDRIGPDFKIPASLLYTLPAVLRKQQEAFESTGGIHAAALFDTEGNLCLLREDVGRHNAVDKLIGASAFRGSLPSDRHILMLSGRASFELIQKAAMAGMQFIVAVGAPSSLAVEMAVEWGMTLAGFLRGERFNIYSGAERILI